MMNTLFNKEFIKKTFTVRRTIAIVIGLFSIGLALVIWPSPPLKSQLKTPSNLQNPIAAADSSDTILASGTREASPTDPQAPTKQTVPAPNPAAIELLNIQVSTLKNEVAQLSEQLVNLQKAFIEQKELLKDKKTVAVKHERRLINGKTSAKEDVGFTILGATNRALVIASGTETKTVPLGDALPDGAVFEGYDGKQIKTSTGFYIVQQ